jgi:hypothetical protein
VNVPNNLAYLYPIAEHESERKLEPEQEDDALALTLGSHIIRILIAELPLDACMTCSNIRSRGITGS